MNYPTDGTMLLLAALVGRCRLDVINGDLVLANRDGIYWLRRWLKARTGRDLNVVSVTAERTR